MEKLKNIWDNFGHCDFSFKVDLEKLINYPYIHTMAQWCHKTYIWVNTDSDNGLLSDSIEPLPVPMSVS